MDNRSFADNSDVLVFSRPRFIFVLGIIGELIVIAFVYTAIAGYPHDLNEWISGLAGSVAQKPIVLLYFLITLLFLPILWSQIRVVRRGLSVVFDKAERKIWVNENFVATFKDVRQVRVTRVRLRRMGSKYELCIDLNGGSRIDMSSDIRPTEYVVIANLIADVVHAPVVQNER